MKGLLRMTVQHLFNSSGNWIAFRKDNYVFDVHSQWIGWLPWNDNDVVNIKGEYFGSIVSPNRFYRFSNKPYRGYPGFPGDPAYPGFPGFPGFAGFSPLPPGASDIEELPEG